VADRRCSAFAPGRVNVIGEHTDYNQGLALPFAILQGVTVEAAECPPDPDGTARVEVFAADLQESDRFELDDPSPAHGWRAFVRGAVAELSAAGMPLVAARLEISGDVPQGAGLSSSAALSVSLCLAIAELGSHASRNAGELPLERVELARICSRVEHRWTGAHTGLLDQLASLYGALDIALLIDFRTLEIDSVPLRLDGWHFAVADSGERHAHAASGYNERRQECVRACELLGVESLREARPEDLAGLPEPEQRRATHVLGENERVIQAVAALRASEPELLGELMNASHASLRDLYQVSTPAVEATVQRLLHAGASGARLVGGGFGGSVLALLAPGVPTPPGALEVSPGPGAHLIT
jgi:galactokinase